MDTWYYQNAFRFPTASSQEKWIWAGTDPAAWFWDGQKNKRDKRKASTGGPADTSVLRSDYWF